MTSPALERSLEPSEVIVIWTVVASRRDINGDGIVLEIAPMATAVGAAELHEMSSLAQVCLSVCVGCVRSPAKLTLHGMNKISAARLSKEKERRAPQTSPRPKPRWHAESVWSITVAVTDDTLN